MGISVFYIYYVCCEELIRHKKVSSYVVTTKVTETNPLPNPLTSIICLTQVTRMINLRLNFNELSATILNFCICY